MGVNNPIMRVLGSRWGRDVCAVCSVGVPWRGMTSQQLSIMAPYSSRLPCVNVACVCVCVPTRRVGARVVRYLVHGVCVCEAAAHLGNGRPKILPGRGVCVQK